MEQYQVNFKNFPVAIAVAALIGILQTFVLLYCWAYIRAYNPLPAWLIRQGVRGFAFFALITCADLVLNVLLCLPAAYAICKLRPAKLAAYLPAAVVPGFVWQYAPLLSAPVVMPLSQFIPGILSAIVMLPLAVLVVRRAAASA
jgi:hypothetical protein